MNKRIKVKIDGVEVTKENAQNVLFKTISDTASLLGENGLIPLVTLGLCPCGCGRVEVIVLDEAKKDGEIKDLVKESLAKFVVDYIDNKGFRRSDASKLN